MDSRFLQSFLCVVELGSIAEAARHLDLAPASIAQRLKALEDILGTPLTVRAGRTVKPTIAGQRIIDHARTVLRDVRALRSAATETDLPAGPLRLGATPSALLEMVPLILKSWIERHPHIEVFIEPAPSTALYSRLINGDVDAALMVRPLFELPKTLEWHTLRTEPLILLTSASMPVSDPVKVLRERPYIRYDRNVVGGKLAEDYLRRIDVRPRVRFELDGIEPIARLVAEGLGVSVLPDWTFARSLDTRLARHSLPEPCPSRTVGIMWQRSSLQSPLADAFLAAAMPLFRTGAREHATA
ncbi:LysR substrate-binding domain-containing protein [Burkholderia sp. Ac-20365]|jgi:DNA-binding transcriptional LysR family regulator|uniref:LysR substrate-binding domain-containing protein n=1 Tax=Burkholderia sp. Ac-20365 TaxID=2703897 RepID=UPI00197B81CD|nr:LysR substrate-binding domain-containing protein [Burkholderia sp. Ac-20365]MBN3763501.1 LysR family transcriptional regulator [Burkholderia sp. Ac-20365]